MSCEICGKTVNLKSCGRCLKVNYCSREHQIAHWKEHKRLCSQIDSINGLVDNESNIANKADNMFSTLNNCNMQTNQVNYVNQSVISNNSLPNSSNQMDEMMKFTSEQSNYNQKVCDGIVSKLNSNLTEKFVSQTVLSSENFNSDFISSACPTVTNLERNFSNANYSENPYQNVTSASNSFNSPVINNCSLSNRDLVFNHLNSYCEIILSDMNQFGFCVIDDFLQNGDLVLNEVYNLYRKGLFQAGQVVNNKGNSNSKLIRGDQIIWVEGNESICSNVGFLIRILDSIITRCNAMSLGEFLKYKITRRTKAMIACYPGNYTKYVRHIDNPNNDGRCITSIYYLNKDYDREVCLSLSLI